MPCGSCRPRHWLGAIVFALALVLFRWATTRPGSSVPIRLPTTTIGPLRLRTRSIAMVLGLIGLAMAFDNLWLLTRGICVSSATA